MPALPQYAASMTAEEFDKLFDTYPAVTATSRAAARQVLVDGLRVVDVASTHAISRQRLTKLLQTLAAPGRRGWARRMVHLPPDLMARVAELEREAAARLNPS